MRVPKESGGAAAGAVLIAGPTASGKSALAIRLAEATGGIVVNADSMQVYRGLDIGTAKPSVPERAEIPHHLIDVADPDDEWSVARFQQEARAAVADIERRDERERHHETDAHVARVLDHSSA